MIDPYWIMAAAGALACAAAWLNPVEERRW